MTWGHYLYAIAGVLLTFWVLMNDSYDPPIINAALASLLIGPFIGVPFFVIVLVFFGNWPVILRNVWGVLTFPIAWHKARATATGAASPEVLPASPDVQDPSPTAPTSTDGGNQQ